MREKKKTSNKRYNKTFVNANIIAAVAEMKRRAYGNANSWGIGEYERTDRKKRKKKSQPLEKIANENLMAMGTGEKQKQQTKNNNNSNSLTDIQTKISCFILCNSNFWF